MKKSNLKIFWEAFLALMGIVFMASPVVAIIGFVTLNADLIVASFVIGIIACLFVFGTADFSGPWL